MSTPSADETASGAAAPATSFAKDIVPIFAPYRDNMLWRFDLTDYDAVQANARADRGGHHPGGRQPDAAATAAAPRTAPGAAVQDLDRPVMSALIPPPARA